MKNPNIQTKLQHSHSKSAWNVVGATLGRKYKIARVPYITSKDEEVSERERKEALRHAEYISACFNHSTEICAKVFGTKYLDEAVNLKDLK